MSRSINENRNIGDREREIEIDREIARESNGRREKYYVFTLAAKVS